MMTVAEIIAAIQRLNDDELRALRAWFAEFDAAAWDRQIEEDVNGGRLDRLGKEAISTERRSRSTTK